MKRFFCLFCAVTLLFLTACQPSAEEPSDVPESTVPTVEPTDSPEPEPTDTPTTPVPDTGFYHPLTGVPTETDLSNKKPVAIMMNNIRAALPQQGNSQADIIYEVLAEGGITRMLAVYLDTSDVELIGSVRSARQYFWELAQGHDAVYIHAGGSPEFYTNKSNSGAFTVDGVNGSFGNTMFWRDRNRITGHATYAYEHSLLTSGEAITAMLANQGQEEHRNGYVYEMTFADDGTPADGQTANTVTASFSSYKNTVFHYDEANKLYLVEEFGEAFIDGNDNTQVSVTNVIVLQTACSVMDDYGRIQVSLSSGRGYFACGGKMIPITWEKGAAADQLRYYTEDGQPLTLGRGRSFVCIIPTSQSVIAE